MQITVKPWRIVLALSAIVTLLTVTDAAVLWVKYRFASDTLYGVTRLFDFNREGNLPAFYSSCALLLAAFLFLVIGGHSRKQGDRWWRHWIGLGAMFVFLGIDEAVELHGLLSRPMREMVDLSGPLIFAWVMPYGLLTIVFAAVYLPFVRALPWRTRAAVAGAASIYVAGALGMEIVSGAIVSAHGGLEGGGLESWQHAVAYTIEEILEMTGVVLTIHALLEYMDERRIRFAVRLWSDDQASRLSTDNPTPLDE
jgi:hypothetical protein